MEANVDLKMKIGRYGEGATKIWQKLFYKIMAPVILPFWDSMIFEIPPFPKTMCQFPHSLLYQLVNEQENLEISSD